MVGEQGYNSLARIYIGIDIWLGLIAIKEQPLFNSQRVSTVKNEQILPSIEISPTSL